jgi:hypothetical protein
MKRRLPRYCYSVLCIGVLATWTPAGSLVAGTPANNDWAFTAPHRPSLPKVKNKEWAQNPIDTFVLNRMEQANLEPAPVADKVTLLRRVTFDLTGLVPTPAERARFLADPSPNAYEKLVDRLLDSPRFGERWAEHWLDVVRYAETEGYKLDRLRPEAYRYRDYVIHAFNEDLPYDRFVRQQIAGDELEPDNPDALIATGFLRLHPEETNGSNYRQVRQDILDDITDNFGLTFLGLTVGCARCHNHKFDPIAQKEYYQFQAFFAPMVQSDGPLASRAAQQEWATHQADWEEATASIRAEAEALVAAPRQAIRDEITAAFDAETQEALRIPEAQRTVLQRQLALLALKQLDRKAFRPQRRLSVEQRAQFDQLKAQLADYDNLRPWSLESVMAVTDIGPVAPPVYRLAGGNLLRPREEVKPGFPKALGNVVPEIIAPNSQATGYRSALARWLTRPDHPLTSRVIVNRLWQEYLGQGIVATPNDFGAQGREPTHPELLDYLATELVRQKWSLKAIHRLIVTSATYRQSSRPEDHPGYVLATKSDPSNKLLWHARIKRREAESIRDVGLQLAGDLNLRMYGPSAHPELPEALMISRYSWYPDDRPEERNRRSVYVFAKRNMQYPLFGAFDEPDRTNSCPTRSTTITAPQALVMLNGSLVHTEARQMALSLLASHGPTPKVLIRAAYLRTFSRPPSEEEMAAAEQFLVKQSNLIAVGPAAPSGPTPDAKDPFTGAVVDFCHALLNSAELLYVD